MSSPEGGSEVVEVEEEEIEVVGGDDKDGKVVNAKGDG